MIESQAKEQLGIYLVIGTCFGVIITKAEVISWFRIQEMFRFQSVYMYAVMASAVATAGSSLFLIRRLGLRDGAGDLLGLAPKEMGSGRRYWIGGMLFGLGWAFVGACPGPLFALVGAGATVIIVPLLSAVLGTWMYGRVRHRLPH
ncbi:MAG: YeeE/YedE thiosulfate transporter family protein [Gemmatimonadaceae bacterium]